jgi:hypothetical protein
MAGAGAVGLRTSESEDAIDDDDTDPSEDEAHRFTGVAYVSKYLKEILEGETDGWGW